MTDRSGAALRFAASLWIPLALSGACRAVDDDPYGVSEFDPEIAAPHALAEPASEIGGAGGSSADPRAASSAGPSSDAEAIAATDVIAADAIPESALLARPGAPVALVDGEPIHADALLPALFLAKAETLYGALEQAIQNRLVRREASRLSVFVDARDVASEVERVLEEQEDQFRLAAGPDADLVGFFEQRYGVSKERYRAVVRERVVQEMFLQRVVRYEARQRERFQARVMLLDDPELAREVVAKLARGASFAALARQHSRDARAGQGGLYPPVAFDCPHELFKGAAELPVGETSDLLPYRASGRPLFRLLRVERRLPADPRPFRLQRADLERELRSEPLDPFELYEWDRRMRERYRIEVELGT